jgi:subtilisin family serine protease
LFVCAAGNNNTDISTAPVYPASFKLDNLVSVTACNNTGKLAWYANFGKGIDIAAPGVEIVSTVPNNTYKSLNGTSMSAGFVSGAAALISSKYPILLQMH